MRRPTRTRRLWIASIGSLLAFVVVAGADVRSFWNYDIWQRGSKDKEWTFVVAAGCAGVGRGAAIPLLASGHVHFDHQPNRSDVLESFWNFEARNRDNSNGGSGIILVGPLWPELILLLIIPLHWLCARPQNAPAFPVITDTKRVK